MRTLFILALYLVNSTLLFAQPPRIPMYSIHKVTEPAEFNKQVCISGMKYFNDALYFASERCPVIFISDPSGNKIIKTINLKVPLYFEMEGLTSFNGMLYLISESIAGVYEIDPSSGSLKTIQTSIPLPEKSKDGDGMEGIAANEKNNKFYLLRERNENMTRSVIYTFSVIRENGKGLSLKYESMLGLPLDNPQWRYSDICYDSVNSKLLCLKSYSKGRTREQFLESISIDEKGELSLASLQNVPVQNFTGLSTEFKGQDYSMNLEGITVDKEGNIYIVSDNTSGKANCDAPAREKTILLQLRKM
jgi:uncharacterized protein YjiK